MLKKPHGCYKPPVPGTPSKNHVPEEQRRERDTHNHEQRAARDENCARCGHPRFGFGPRKLREDELFGVDGVDDKIGVSPGLLAGLTERVHLLAGFDNPDGVPSPGSGLFIPYLLEDGRVQFGASIDERFEVIE